MDNFIVSARKYRPATFNTVVGQSAITNTLKNAIKNQQIAQAFLFTGPRGVGKTTCARIMAKTINCSNITPEGEACNTCASCLSFDKSASFNIFELDAASNNTVDDIRNLVDQVRIPPQHGYKVYIVDEVHMLSTSAFNAFLKTLEEPPPYAKFILATTEKHKILPTILSRCQIFDFRRISVDDIAKHLEWVAKSENIVAEPEALHVIAQKADGGLRDALSMFDQLVSFAGNQLSYKQVLENLNVLDHEYYFKITDFILSGDISNALITINEIIENGFEGQHFITGLGQHLRNLMVSKDKVTVQLLETSNAIKEQYFIQAAKCSISFLLQALETINECDINYKTSNNKKLHVEISLMLMCRLSFSGEVALVTNSNLGVPKVDVPSTKTDEPTVSYPKTEPVSHPVIQSKPDENTLKASITPPVVQSSTSAKVSGTLTGLALGDLMSGTVAKTFDTKDVEVLPVPEVSHGNESFYQNDLDKIWPTAVKEVAKDFPLMESTLRWKLPVLNDDFSISIHLENRLQQDEIIKHKPELTVYLRMKLKNDSITINTVLVEGVTEVRKPYTDKEKFEYVAQKAPAIRDLKDQLGLELEM